MNSFEPDYDSDEGDLDDYSSVIDDADDTPESELNSVEANLDVDGADAGDLPDGLANPVEDIAAEDTFQQEFDEDHEFAAFNDLNTPIRGADPAGDEAAVAELRSDYRTVKAVSERLEPGKVNDELVDFVRNCRSVFRRNCKSLELPAMCAWLRVQQDGLEGLNDVLGWIASAQFRYGRRLYPREVSDYARWVYPFLTTQTGLGMSPLVDRIYNVAVTQDEDGASPVKSLWDLQAAERDNVFASPKTGPKKALKFGEHPIFSLWQGCYNAEQWKTKFEYYETLYSQLQRAIVLAQRVNQQCRELYESELETSHPIVDRQLIELLNRLSDLVAALVKVVHPTETLVKPPVVAPSPIASRSAKRQGPVVLGDADQAQDPGDADPYDADAYDEYAYDDDGPMDRRGSIDFETILISNREEALQLLEKVAEYFLQQEIHSPIGYRLAEAYNWSQMKLPDLLKRVIGADTDHFARLTERLSLDATEDPEEEEPAVDEEEQDETT